MANVTQKIQTFLGGVSRKADFDKIQGQVVEANNCYPDETYGMIKRPGTELLGTLGIDFATANDLYFFPIIREGQSRYLCGVGNGTIRMWSLDDPSVAITVNTTATSTSYLNYASYNGILVNDAYRATSDDRRTIIVNRTMVCAEDTTLWSTGVDIDGNNSIDPFTWTNRTKNRNANSIDDLPDGRCVRIHVTNGGSGSSTRPLREGVHYLPVTVDDADNNGNPIITEGFGLVIKCQVNASGYIDSANLDGCEIWASGSGYPDQCPASIDGIPGSTVTIATGLRPTMVYRVVNSNADNDDMYFQAFSNETTSDDFPGYVPGPRDRVDGPYLWKECPSPDAYVGINPSTLPHQLRKDPNNPNTFIFEPVDYSYRWAGDNTNNPAPSFIGSTINNAFFMNNRLGFLSEDNVVLSRPINYGPSYATPQDYVPSDNPWVMRNYTEIDFFRQSAIALNDADLIDIKAANNHTSIFHTAISTPQGTILFADGQQSLLFQPQGLLSPLTASINSLSNYDMTGDVNAVIVGKKYFFVNKSAKFCRVYSMINQGMQNPPVIEDVTKEVADWLPNDMTDLVACPTDNMIFLFNRTRNDIYTRREIGEDSSWVKWSHSHPVISLIVDHDLIFFMTSSDDDIQVSVARLYLMPDDYTLGESRTVYGTSEFTSIPDDHNYYNNIIGDTALVGTLTGVLEYYKPWHNYYGDLNLDPSLNDTFDQWLPWEDNTPVNALISVSADERAADAANPWNVSFKITVRSAAGNTEYSPSTGSYALPYDTKFRIRNISSQPDAYVYDSTVVRCDTTPIHEGTTPPPYDSVRYIGRYTTDDPTNSMSINGSDPVGSGHVYVSPWFTPDTTWTGEPGTGYTGDPYLYIGGTSWRVGGAIYYYSVVDHWFDPNSNNYLSQVDTYTPWVNYKSRTLAPDNNNNTEFGSYSSDGKISIPWRSKTRMSTNDMYHSVHGNLSWELGGISGYGFSATTLYPFDRASTWWYFFINHSGVDATTTFSEIDGYWEFKKDGQITRWAGYDVDGTLRTTLPIDSPCSDPYSSNPDECCNDIWIVKNDGTEYNSGIRAKSFEVIPDGDEVIVKYVPCTTSTFDPATYQYGRFVGKATITGHPADARNNSRFMGSWIDSETGDIDTDWIQFGDYMNIGGPFNARLTVGGGAYRTLGTGNPQPDGGPFSTSGSNVYTNSWSPIVNFYDGEYYSSTNGQQFGDINNGEYGVKWRNSTFLSIGYMSGYSDLNVYFGGIYTDSSNYPGHPQFLGLEYMSVVLDGDFEYYDTNNVRKIYPENRVGTITGHWEFTNSTSEGTQVTWDGVDENGNSSVNFSFTRRFTASTFKTAYLRVIPTACCVCPTEPTPPIVLNALSLDPNMDLYTTNVTVSGTTVTPPASFPKVTNQKMTYVIANLPGSTAVASDRAGDTGTLTWNSDHTLTADTDLSGYATSLIIGYRFNYQLVLPTFYYNQGNSDFDYTASLTVSRVKFALGLSGQADFEINVRNGPGWESSYSQIISNEYLASTAPLSEPAIVSVPIHKRNNDFQLQVKSDSPFPLSVDSCMWEGNYSPRYYRRT